MHVIEEPLVGLTVADMADICLLSCLIISSLFVFLYTSFLFPLSSLQSSDAPYSFLSALLLLVLSRLSTSAQKLSDFFNYIAFESRKHSPCRN
jgi:hypothetical protein